MSFYHDIKSLGVYPDIIPNDNLHKKFIYEDGLEILTYHRYYGYSSREIIDIPNNSYLASIKMYNKIVVDITCHSVYCVMYINQKIYNMVVSHSTIMLMDSSRTIIIDISFKSHMFTQIIHNLHHVNNLDDLITHFQHIFEDHVIIDVNLK